MIQAEDRVELTVTLDHQTIWARPSGLRGTVIRQHRLFKHLSVLVRFDGDDANRWARSNMLRVLNVVERVAELESRPG